MIVGPTARHELLHTVSLIANLFDREVIQHRAYADSQSSKVVTLAESVALSLGCLYQALGEENLEREWPSDEQEAA